MPGNFNAPSHEAVRAVARREPFANRLRDMPFREGKVVSPAAEYADMLTDAGCRVDAWETVYVHELTGEHPVLDWITGTALRPVIDRLSEEAWQQFRQQLIPLLDEAVSGAAGRPDVLSVPPGVRGGSGRLSGQVIHRTRAGPTCATNPKCLCRKQLLPKALPAKGHARSALRRDSLAGRGSAARTRCTPTQG